MNGYLRKSKLNTILKHSTPDQDPSFINSEKFLMLFSPSAKSIETFKNKIREAFKASMGSNAEQLIKTINAIIRGWANSKKHWHGNAHFIN